MHKVNGNLHYEIGRFRCFDSFPTLRDTLVYYYLLLDSLETWNFEELNWKLTSKSAHQNKNRKKNKIK